MSESYAENIVLTHALPSGESEFQWPFVSTQKNTVACVCTGFFRRLGTQHTRTLGLGLRRDPVAGNSFPLVFGVRPRSFVWVDYRGPCEAAGGGGLKGQDWALVQETPRKTREFKSKKTMTNGGTPNALIVTHQPTLTTHFPTVLSHLIGRLFVDRASHRCVFGTSKCQNVTWVCKHTGLQ